MIMHVFLANLQATKRSADFSPLTMRCCGFARALRQAWGREVEGGGETGEGGEFRKGSTSRTVLKVNYSVWH